MLVKTIKIGKKEVTFKASAAIPRLYRVQFKRDLISDIAHLSNSLEKVEKDASEQEKFSVLDLTIFENIAYIMARHADPKSVPNNIDDWLDTFEVFDIYTVLPEIISLWGDNMETMVTSPNADSQSTGK